MSTGAPRADTATRAGDAKTDPLMAQKEPSLPTPHLGLLATETESQHVSVKRLSLRTLLQQPRQMSALLRHLFTCETPRGRGGGPESTFSHDRGTLKGAAGGEGWCTHLHNSAEVTIGCQLQALLLGPRFDMPQLLADNRPPVVRAQPRLGVGYQSVEEPHVDEVEELREELDGQGGVDSAAPQQRHGPRERVQDVICSRHRRQGSLRGAASALGSGSSSHSKSTWDSQRGNQGLTYV